VFEWKPVTIKMRLFSADNVDVVPLLGELTGVDVIQRFECDGKSYGAIRNFRKYQRPKSPHAVHPLPDGFRDYVALPKEISEKPKDKPPEFPPKGEITPQREEGGGVVKDEGKDSTPTDLDIEINTVGADAPDDEMKFKGFEGAVIQATAEEVERWCGEFPHIHDLRAELLVADAWAVDKPPGHGRWRAFLVRWMTKANADAVSEPGAEKHHAETVAALVANLRGQITVLETKEAKHGYSLTAEKAEFLAEIAELTGQSEGGEGSVEPLGVSELMEAPNYLRKQA